MNIIIKKGDFNVYLFYILIYNRRKRKNRFIIYELYYQCESVIIIIIFLLFESLDNLTCFIMNDFLFEISLHDVDLMISKNINF